MNNDQKDRRFIEECFPLREISLESAREKSLRHGHISTLHMWWARRPLIASRAVIFALLYRDPKSETERKELTDFIIEFCKWENSNDAEIVRRARHLLSPNSDEKIRVLDCFAGGGSIPLEALRLGLDAHALELNPVAVLVELCTLVYPQKYGQTVEIESDNMALDGKMQKITANKLSNDVQKWGRWVFDRSRDELLKFYPKDATGGEPISYFWMRTLRCPNPKCKAEIPLFRQLWLAKSKKRRIALQPVLNTKKKEVTFTVAIGEDIKSDPSQRTVKRASARCMLCSSTLRQDQTKLEAKAGRMGQRLVAVSFYPKNNDKKHYRIADKEDVRIFDLAKEKLQEIIQTDKSLIPYEKMPPIGTYGIDAQRYTVNETWSELYNRRQLLALITLCLNVKAAYQKMLDEKIDPEYAKAVTTYLGLAIDRCANQNSAQCVWVSNGEKIAISFGRQAIPTVWDYVEANILGDHSWSWLAHVGWVAEVIESCSAVSDQAAKVRQGTATRIPYPDRYFDAVLTDPPYYDAVPYSDLSDFFYVWLKRSIGNLYPDLFSTPLTPKLAEIVQNPVFKVGDGVKDKQFFETEMTKALGEMKRVLKDDGMCGIVFAHKTITAWETLINALLSAGFTVTSSWPVHTERPGRLRAQESAALASSVWLVCRKRRAEADVGSWKDVQKELDERVKERLDHFLGQGIKGADALLSAIGPALEVFGKYKRVERVSGEQITVVEFLERMREAVAHHALATVLSEQELGKVDPETALYVLWKWTFESNQLPQNNNGDTSEEEIGEIQDDEDQTSGGDSHIYVAFNDALNLARAVGADVQSLLRLNILKQKKEFIRLTSPLERIDLLSKDISSGTTLTPLIDMIHRALLLWSRQQAAELEEYLNTSGMKDNNTFWRISQALSNLLPLQSKEKQLLDGFLAGRAAGEFSKKNGHKTIDEFIGR